MRKKSTARYERGAAEDVTRPCSPAGSAREGVLLRRLADG